MIKYQLNRNCGKDNMPRFATDFLEDLEEQSDLGDGKLSILLIPEYEDLRNYGEVGVFMMLCFSYDYRTMVIIYIHLIFHFLLHEAFW